MHSSGKPLSLFALIPILAVLFCIVFILSFFLGRYPIPPKELWGIFASRIFPLKRFWPDEMEVVLFRIRLPRILAACFVGGSLSVAGAAYQSVFQNPMASPDILGASSGAAFGAALSILLGKTSEGITFFAFAFSLISVALVFGLSRAARSKQILALILSGIMVGSLFSSGTSFIKLVADQNNQLPVITYWLMGSLAGASAADLRFIGIPLIIGLVPLFALSWPLNILTQGDDEARSMGVNANIIRLIAVVCASLITAACVSISGMIGWVGLVIPHVTRRLAGNDNRALLPVSLFTGAFFLLIVDNISRTLFLMEIPLGILTSLVGIPFFLYLLSKKTGSL